MSYNTIQNAQLANLLREFASLDLDPSIEGLGRIHAGGLEGSLLSPPLSPPSFASFEPVGDGGTFAAPEKAEMVRGGGDEDARADGGAVGGFIGDICGGAIDDSGAVAVSTPGDEDQLFLSVARTRKLRDVDRKMLAPSVSPAPPPIAAAMASGEIRCPGERPPRLGESISPEDESSWET